MGVDNGAFMIHAHHIMVGYSWQWNLPLIVKLLNTFVHQYQDELIDVEKIRIPDLRVQHRNEVLIINGTIIA